MGGYRCCSCGSNDLFRANFEIRQLGSEERILNSEGDTEEFVDLDIYDSETLDGPVDIECEDCGSSDVRWFDSDEEFNERQPPTPKKQKLTKLLEEI